MMLEQFGASAVTLHCGVGRSNNFKKSDQKTIMWKLLVLAATLSVKSSQNL